MINQRLHKRLNCERLGYLHLSDSSHLAAVRNISASGVLVHFYNPLPGVQVGDICKVGLKGDPFLKKYDCEVVRVEPSGIALRFLGMTM
jgi:hypothetical protein